MFTKSGIGLVDKDEISKAFKTGYMDLEPAAWERMVEEADGDGDGKISQQEFKDVVKGFSKQGTGNRVSFLIQ